MIVTIDGMPGQGKSVLAERLAKELSVECLSSGSLYRCVTANYLDRLEQGILPDSALAMAIDRLSLAYLESYPNSKLRSDEVCRCVGEVSKSTAVRDKVNSIIKEYCSSKNIVVDGRDMNSILPFAQFKFFFESSFEQRAKMTANHRGIPFDEALNLVAFRDDAELDFSSPPDDSIVMHPIEDGIECALAKMKALILKDAIAVTGPWEIDYIGELNNGVKVFSNAKDAYLKSSGSKLIVFTSQLEYYSHPSLLFLEQYIPYCCYALPLNTQCEFKSKRVQITVYGGAGYISIAKSGTPMPNKFRYPNAPKYALCSHENGLQFLKKNGAHTVSIRAEFFERYKYDKSKRNFLLDFACNSFEQVFFRLYDNSGSEKSDAISEENRGAKYLDANFEFFLYQIDLAEEYYRKFGNVELLVPFLRNEIEVANVLQLLAERFNGSVAVMIEIPLMIYRFKYYHKKCETFVIGVGDLSSLLSAFARNEMCFGDQINELIADMIKRYIFPYASAEQTVFVTSQPICNLLSDSQHRCKLFHLAKY
jgi:cytidylate kinase